MENFFTEILFPFRKPSDDTSLVIFFDRSVHTDEAQARQYVLNCSKYAAKYQVYLITGLFFHQSNLCLCMFDPKGSPLCRQGALYLPPAFSTLLEPDSSISVVDTPLAKFFLCAGDDILHPQVIRAAMLKGAQIIISVQHLEFAIDTNERLTHSIWESAQSNEVYVISLTTNFYAVSCPVLMTHSKSGYLLRKNTYIPARFGINTEKLMEIRQKSGLLTQMNYKLLENHQNELVSEL